MKKKEQKFNKDSLIIYGIYCKIIANEKHYTILQSKYRMLAAYWLLVICAAIGIIFSSKEANIPFDHFLSTSIICFFGLIGNTIFWYEDVILHEKYLNINHLEGFSLENRYSWLPQVHHQHLCFSHKTMLRFKNIFYVGCSSFMFVILETAIMLYLLKYHYYINLLVLFVFLLLFLLFSKNMFIKAYKNELFSLKEYLND